MFFHNFKYSLKTLFKDKSLIFWTLAFPLIMGTFFHLAFKDITENDKLKTIDIAVIDNNEFNSNMIYKTTIDHLSTGNDKLFNTKFVDKTKAKKLLKDKKIAGYLELKNNKPILTIKANGIDETIFKYVIDEIEQTNSIATNLQGKYSPDRIYQIIGSTSMEEVTFNNKSKGNIDMMVVEFYTLIAMTCLYGAIISMTSVNKTLPNMSNVGKRVSISPTNN